MTYKQEEGTVMLSGILSAAVRRHNSHEKTAGCKIPPQYLSKQKSHKKEKKATIIKDAGLAELVKRAMGEPGSVVPGVGDEGRTQEVHEQQLQFADDKHNLELMRMQMELEQQNAQFELQQEHAQEEAQGKMQDMAMNQEQTQAVAQQKQEQVQEQKQEQMQQQSAQQDQQKAQQQQVTAQRDDQYRKNMMKSSAVRYNEYGEPVMPSSALPSILAGAGLGGAAAHTIVPNALAAKFQEQAAAITPEMVEASKVKGAPMTPLKIIDHANKKYDITTPDFVKKKFLKNKALQANAKRLLAGLGIGAVAGYGLNQYMDQSSG